MITHRLKVTENRTIERLDHKPIVSKSNGADFIQFTFENPSEWSITGVLIVYMFNGTPYGSCVIDQDSNGNPLALTNVDGSWQLTVPVPYQCITSEGYLYTGISLFRTDVDASASTDTTPHIIAKLSTALLSQPIQILKNGGLDEIDVAASPNDDLLVRMKLFVDNFSTEWMENVDNKFDSIGKTLNGDSETGGGVIANVTTNTNNIQDLQKRIDELDDDVDALDVVVNGAEEIIDDDGSIKQEKVTGLVELQKEDAEEIEKLNSGLLAANTNIAELTDKTDSLTTKTDNNTTEITKLNGALIENLKEAGKLIDKNASDITALKSTVENPVFDDSFSKTSTSAVQNKVLTNLFDGIDTTVSLTKVADDTDSDGTEWSQLRLSQQFLAYDESSGDFSFNSFAARGYLCFEKQRFSVLSGRNSTVYRCQLLPNQTFNSLTVTNSISADEDSTLVPTTAWVKKLIGLSRVWPFHIKYEMNFKSSTNIENGAHLILYPSETPDIIQEIYDYEGYGVFGVKTIEGYANTAMLCCDAYSFNIYGNMSIIIDNVSSIREAIGNYKILFNELTSSCIQTEFKTDNVAIDNSKDDLIVNVPLFYTSSLEENETEYWKLTFNLELEKADGSSFTEDEVLKMSALDTPIQVICAGYIKPTDYTNIPPR